MLFARSLALIFILAAGMPLIAQAHTTGAFWNAQDGPYTVDLGYDPASFTAGQYTRFDFLLWKGPADTGTSANFAQVWVRIMRTDGRSTLLATGIWKQPIGPTTLLYEFQEPGAYTMETSYRDADGNEIAVASFPISVAPPATSLGTVVPLASSFIVGCFLGAVLFFLSGRYRKKLSARVGS
jgi:hypothetical protein